MIAQTAQIIRRLACLIFIGLTMMGCGTQPEIRPSATAITSSADNAAAVALRQVGVPYRYGGSTPGGFDCSGLVHYSYARAGIVVPRTTATLWQNMRPVAKEQLRRGDVLFFNIAGKMSHVGMYIGGGRFVHAPSSGKTVSVASLNSDYYRKALIRAGRPE